MVTKGYEETYSNNIIRGRGGITGGAKQGDGGVKRRQQGEAQKLSERYVWNSTQFEKWLIEHYAEHREVSAAVSA